MKVPFSPPKIDQNSIDKVVEILKSGWITTGPITKKFESMLADYCGVPKVLCVNSASAGLELILRWFGVQEGDEVILPAYTYCATANVIVHCGAKPVMVDINPDFLINTENIAKAITPRTKVIMPVDIAGYPCDYDEINRIVNSAAAKKLFTPKTDEQKSLGRILVLSDAAHSLGATYKHKKAGSLTDITVFSFHAVKNLTTAEGGAICFNLPEQFSSDDLYKTLCTKSLHGQSKDALAKTQIGNWRYDVVEAGYKCNMPDILAALGFVELQRYDEETLVKRKFIFDKYQSAFENDDRFQLPEYQTNDKCTSFHVFLLRLKNATEPQRDEVMNRIFAQEVAVNVHFIPLPMLTAYKNKGYNIDNYPVTYDCYSREISLPVFYDMSDAQIEAVIAAVKASV